MRSASFEVTFLRSDIRFDEESVDLNQDQRLQNRRTNKNNFDRDIGSLTCPGRVLSSYRDALHI
jgi:hypothetical protein